MSSQTISLALMAIIAVLVGGVFLFGSSPDPIPSAGPDSSILPPRITIDVPESALRGDALVLAAQVERADPAEVQWVVEGKPAGVGETLEIIPERVGTIEIDARVSDVTGREAKAVEKVAIGENPLDDDDDGDGLDNRAELAAGTSPTNADTDDDGVSDAIEVNGLTDPRNPDTDGDSVPDGFELAFLLDPIVGDADADADADGFDNAAEFEAGTNPRNHRFYPGSPFEATKLLDAEGMSLRDRGLTVVFEAEGLTRTSSTVEAGSGIFYIEATRQPGVAANLGLVDADVGVPTSGDQRISIQLPSASAVGLVIDARTADLGVWTIRDNRGVPELDERISLGPFFSVAATVSGSADGTVTVNAGDDPVGHPLAFGPHYLLFNSGLAEAEFMGLGFGSVNTYSGPEQPIDYPDVRLTVNEHTGRGVRVGSDGRTVAYTDSTGKYGVLANQGMIGEFRYWESTRLTAAPDNLGQGILTRYSLLDPYPGSLEDQSVPSQPGMSLNSLQAIWRYPTTVATYDNTNTVYGFAVDYRSARPTVYVIVGDELVATVPLEDVFTPVHPAMYGTVFNTEKKHRANFGTDAFTYDAPGILAAAGVDTSDLVLGWGAIIGEVARPGAGADADGATPEPEAGEDDG